jgi:hypothetical protein
VVIWETYLLASSTQSPLTLRSRSLLQELTLNSGIEDVSHLLWNSIISYIGWNLSTPPPPPPTFFSHNQFQYCRIQVLTTMTSVIFWVVMPCSSEVAPRVREAYHQQSEKPIGGNIILTFTPKSSEWFLPSRFCNPDFLFILKCPICAIRLWVKIIKLLGPWNEASVKVLKHHTVKTFVIIPSLCTPGSHG